MPGQYKTQAELINETLAALGVLSAGQPTDPEDYSYVATRVDPTVRKLAALEIVYVADVDNIPGAWFADLVDILAGECSTKFGATPDDQQMLIQKGLGVPPGSGSAAQSLKQMNRGRPTGEAQRAHYF